MPSKRTWKWRERLGIIAFIAYFVAASLLYDRFFSGRQNGFTDIAFILMASLPVVVVARLFVRKRSGDTKKGLPPDKENEQDATRVPGRSWTEALMRAAGVIKETDAASQGEHPMRGRLGALATLALGLLILPFAVALLAYPREVYAIGGGAAMLVFICPLLIFFGSIRFAVPEKYRRAKAFYWFCLIGMVMILLALIVLSVWSAACSVQWS